MSQFSKKRRMTKLIGIGAIIVLPIVFGFSILFSELKMANPLSVFLTVLISCIAIFIYYLLFTYFERKAIEKKQVKKDPFSE